MIEFKEIIGFPEYLLYNDGRIYDIKYSRFVVIASTKSKYKMYALRCGIDKRKTFSIHRLLAVHFIPNPENKPQVNHIDGNKYNNSLDNLEWVTNQENRTHAKDNGLISRGEKVIFSKLKSENIIEIRNLHRHGVKTKEISIRFLVSRATVRRIINKKCWAHV